MSDVSFCSECGSEELLTEFGADLLLSNRYYTDFYCEECGYSGRVYRMEFGREVFGVMDERGVEPAVGRLRVMNESGMVSDNNNGEEEVLVRGFVVPDSVRVYTVWEDAELELCAVNESDEVVSASFFVAFPDDVEWREVGGGESGTGTFSREVELAGNRREPISLELKHSREAIEEQSVLGVVSVGDVVETTTVSLALQNNEVAAKRRRERERMDEDADLSVRKFKGLVMSYADERDGVSFSEVVEEGREVYGLDEDEVEKVMDSLVDDGVIIEVDDEDMDEYLFAL